MSLPLLIAHRGASADQPENTLPAFAEAWKQGADGIEGDFHLTADGVIVCHHDPVIRRRGQPRRRLAAHPLERLRQIDLAAPGAPTGPLRLPTLDEVLDLLPADRCFFFEAKMGPAIIPPLQAALARRPGIADRFTLLSFDPRCLDAARAAGLPGGRSRLLHFQRRMAARPERAARAILEELARLDCRAVGLEADRRIAPAFLAHLQQAGITCHLWTVDAPEDARYWCGLGVASLTTNRPGKIREALKSNPPAP